MDIPMKYEDVVAKLDAALGREAALREELARYKSLFGQAQKAIDRLNELHPKRMGELAKRLTVAEQLLRETSDYLDGSTRNAVWCDSILHKKMKAALKPAAECPHNYSNPTGCPVCQGIKP